MVDKNLVRNEGRTQARRFATVVVPVVLALTACQRPYWLTRTTAAMAIRSTAQFQHKTKLYFEIAEAESVVGDLACHNFDFLPAKMPVMKHYLDAGTMKFSPYGNQSEPNQLASVGSLDLSLGSAGFLVDQIESCGPRAVNKTTGGYELTLGNTVVEVNGIRKNSDRAFVDFTWHFESLNEVGQSLPMIQITKQMEAGDERLSAEQKSRAPFWVGSAEFEEYDDGWRVKTINLEPRNPNWGPWSYGPPNWPDPSFNWAAFDEDENHY
jgi:hypothetical protein